MASSAPAQPADRARGATRHPAGFGLLGGVGVQAAPQHLLAGEPLIPAPIRAAPGRLLGQDVRQLPIRGSPQERLELGVVARAHRITFRAMNAAVPIASSRSSV